MSGFPRPEEVRQQFEQTLQPIADILRAEIFRVFGTPTNGQGGWSFDPIRPIAKMIHPPTDYQTLKAAFEIVKFELAQSGWEAIWRSHRSEHSISILPLLPRSQYD